MNLAKKIIAGISAMAMFSVCCVSTVHEVSNIDTAEAVVDDCNDDWLHAEGSHLYDMNGNEVWLTGANWFGFNCGERFPHGLWSADVDQLLSAIADRGINCLRLPVATELLMDWKDGVDDSDQISINPKNSPDYSFNPDFCRPDGSCMSSLEIFDVIAKKCKKYGIKIIVDIHSPALHNSGHNYNVWYYNSSAGDADNMAVTADGTKVTTEMWQETLVWLAERYNNDDTIIAYDLKNEPHGKGQDGVASAKWDGSTDDNNWAYASTQCALEIMKVNPNALILIEGVEQYPKEGKTWGQPDSKTDPPYYPGWWGGQFRGVRDYPIDLGEYQSQLVYSPHDYGPGVYNQTWFQKDFTTQTLLDDYWYDTWAFINAEDIAPLLIGEWGGFMDGAENEKWLNLLRDYMIDNHINHTFWCLNPNSGDTGGLLDYSFSSWDEEKYALFEPSLWQDEDGVYISLDHQVALGKNGQSLSEFYSSGKNSNLDASGETNPKDPNTPSVSTTETTPADTTVTSDSISETIVSSEDSDISTTETTPVDTTVTSDSVTGTTVSSQAPEMSTPSETATDISSSNTSSSDSNNPSKETLLGDVTCDGEVLGSDLLMLKKYVLGLTTLEGQSLINADVSGDGNVMGNDLLILKKYVLGLIDTL